MEPQRVRGFAVRPANGTRKIMTKKSSKSKGPSREPQNISGTAWYYEGRRYFDFVHEIWENGQRIKTVQFRVLASQLRKSLDRSSESSNGGGK